MPVHRYAPLFLLSALSTLYSEDPNAHMRHLENRVTALELRKGASSVINPSARPQLRGSHDLFITGDLLLWQAHEDGLPLFIQSQGTSDSLQHAKAHSLDWRWNWGFRVGAGYNMLHDDWDLSLEWLCIDGHARDNTYVGSDNSLWPTLIEPSALNVAGSNSYLSAHSRWNLHLNQIDLTLGRPFFVSRWLALRPHIGLRSDWIRQKLRVLYQRAPTSPHTDYDLDLHNHFWGIGLATGLHTQWAWGAGWSLYGDIAGAILYGYQHLHRDDDLSVDIAYTNLKQSDRISRCIGDLEAGLRWDKIWDEDRLHVGLQIGWENHIYFNQNQFPRFVDDVAIGTMLANQGDLTFQGWTFSARFDF